MGNSNKNMRDQLINLIMGSQNLDQVPKGWSPNNIKALIITRWYAIVIYHTKEARQVVFNEQGAYDFITANGGKGKLENVLNRRIFSCLEEIYVDSLFQEYRGALDLVEYVRKMQNQGSRLRYYGYILDQGSVTMQEVQQRYYQARMQKRMDYTLALDTERKVQINAIDTKNTDWYKKHNLRPSEYPADGEKGELSRWFKAVENAIGGAVAEAQSGKELGAKMEILKGIIFKDGLLVQEFDDIFDYCKLARSGAVTHITGVEECLKPLTVGSFLTGDEAKNLVNFHITNAELVELAKANEWSPAFTKPLSLLFKRAGVIRNEPMSLEEVTKKVEELQTAGKYLTFYNYQGKLHKIMHSLFNEKTKRIVKLRTMAWTSVVTSLSLDGVHNMNDVAEMLCKAIDECFQQGNVAFMTKIHEPFGFITQSYGAFTSVPKQLEGIKEGMFAR